ncbi:MAG: CHAD domain-containing protein [Gammaproteobacteria bacterium]
MDATGLLTLSAARAARMIALAQLDAAVAAYGRFDNPDDPEALHDFRVALRRLRSCMQTYQDVLSDTLSKKSRKQLRRFARATNEARDAEVRIEWLRSQEHHLPARQRIGWLWLLERLEARKAKAYDEIRARVIKDFLRLEPKLRKQLQRYTVAYDLHGQMREPPFTEIIGKQIKQHSKELEQDLWRAASSTDMQTLHNTRIQVKRLRYLLEPMQEEIKDGKQIIKELKGLQDLLGDLHDAHLHAQEITLAVETAAAGRARRLLEIELGDETDPARLRAEQRRNEHAGLVTLARLAKARTETLFTEITAHYLDDGAQALVRRITRLGQSLLEKARGVK